MPAARTGSRPSRRSSQANVSRNVPCQPVYDLPLVSQQVPLDVYGQPIWTDSFAANVIPYTGNMVVHPLEIQGPKFENVECNFYASEAFAHRHDSISSSEGDSPEAQDDFWTEEDLCASPVLDPAVEASADPLFPSPHKFNLMVCDYLRGLSPKQRQKALLTQKMYNAVMMVLVDPKNTSIKTAQFRFWTKKMFSITNYGGDDVIVHETRPVAVRENMYEVLCHCHNESGHGGRDKTSAQVSIILLV